MPPHVYFQGTASHEPLVAKATGIGSITRMTLHVVREVAVSREIASTVFHLAPERLLTVVNAHVCFQVAPLCESLATAVPRALKRFYSRL